MTEELYLIVVGSRTFHNYDLLKEECDNALKEMMNDYNTYYRIIIVSGGAKGADALAEKYAHERGYDLMIFPADWNSFGKSAGYKRNLIMHETISKYPHRKCIAFWDGMSKGTQHSFNLCNRFRTELKIIRYN